MKTTQIAMCVAFVALSACANPQANSAANSPANAANAQTRAIAQNNAAQTPAPQAQMPAQAPAYAPYPQAYPQVPQHYTRGLPASITQTVQQMYPGSFIVDVDFEGYGYEIKLNNYMELFFDTNGKFLGQKWDD